MKQALVRFLAVLGLVPARRYAALSRQLDEVNHHARDWKKRANELTTRVARLEAEVRERERLLEACRTAAEQEQATDFTAMQARLIDTERDLALAREHLMAIEVKLDILEGAANVLDARTRMAAQRQSGVAVGD